MFASNEHKLNCCRLAFEGIEKVEVSDWEMCQGGVSYSYITCEWLAKEYPSANRYFIVGEDMLSDFSKWRNPERILECVSLASCARVDKDRFIQACKKFELEYNSKVATIDFVGKDVSSTMIRALSAMGESVSEYTIDSVDEYLLNNKVYLIDGLDGVKEFLTEERFAHVKNVVLLAVGLCSKYKIDEKKAVQAAALHDIAKYLTLDSPYLDGFIPPKGVPSPVMHQFSGAYVAANTFNVTDEDVLSAIKYHTSARPDMSNLEMLIFLSDLLEPSRTFADADDLRLLLKHDLRTCMHACLKSQIMYLRSAGKPIYPLTEEAYEYYKLYI